MRDTVRKVNAFSTSVPNQPGQAFKVLAALVSAGVNLLGCTGLPRGRRARSMSSPTTRASSSPRRRRPGSPSARRRPVF